MAKIKSQLKKIKPTTSGQRGMSFVLRNGLSKEKPIKSLTTGFKRHVGRDEAGHVSIRHKGGGAKRKYRIISTITQCTDGPFEVLRLEYDPNRTAFIALIQNQAGRKSYIIAPDGIKIGDKLEYGQEAPIVCGCRLPLSSIPTGVQVHNIDIVPFGKAKMVRSAGTSAVVIAHEEKYSLLRLPSSEIRKFDNRCEASIGVVSNIAHNTETIGKAGRQRHKGIRPHVRGKAMAPNAHPHGGGEGVNPIGLKAPKTPWGKKAIGVKTRRRPDHGNMIVTPRKKKRK